MTAHPFDIKASASANPPDELMITWGNMPEGSIASIYLPAVASADIITLANSMYGSHRLSVSDEHTIQCPSGNVTLVPVPQGQGRYAGLLSVDLPSAGRRSHSYTIAVRQLTQVSSSSRPPAPPIQIAERRTPEIAVPPKPFSWRQAQGAFQYTITVKPAGESALSAGAPAGVAQVAHRGDAAGEPLASGAGPIPQLDRRSGHHFGR